LNLETDPSSAGAETSLAGRCVRALLDRHGLPKYRHSPWLADTLGLSYSQAHRRMSGASPWSLEDLQKVASALGERLADVVTLDGGMDFVPATVKLGAATFACRLCLGPRLADAAPHDVVAVSTADGWVALCASDASDGATFYGIERLEATPNVVSRKLVAVLDDDRDVADSICAHLQGASMDARPFYRIADLLGGVDQQRYDAFVIDWIVGDASASKLIATLRARSASCPIIVLTAQVVSGVVEEEEIAEAVSRYDLVFSEKPVRMSILSATLARIFAATPTGAGPGPSPPG